MNRLMLLRYARVALLLALLLTGDKAIFSDSLLINGDFESPPVLGPGQTAIPIGGAKMIINDPAISGYSNNISGITGWNYTGTVSDHGLARRNADFGLPSSEQAVFINNWNRMLSQTVSQVPAVGETVSASIDFGTLGSDGDRGRAGRFYLVAGEADPANSDQFSSRSIVLDEVTIANPTWSVFTPDWTVGNREYFTLHLSHAYEANDPALGLPLTIAFRTESGSAGYTYWDNASLQVVPEPSSLALLGIGTLGFAGVYVRRLRKNNA